MTEVKSLVNRIKGLFSKQEGLEDLLRASENYDGYKRENAIRRLGVLGNPIALPEVLERINDWVPQVRDAAKFALRRLATSPNAMAYVECLPTLYRLRGRWRDNHAETISFVEMYLCSPENSAAVISGTASKDKAVSRYSALLCIEHRLLPLEGLVDMGLAHADVSVRLKAASLISELPESSRHQVFSGALRNTFMPVRRMAILHSIRVGISEAEACRHLFDNHPSVRSIVVSEYKAWTQSPLVAYQQKINSAVRREKIIAAWGVGEYGKPGDAEILRPLLTSKDVKLRRQAIASYAKLLEDDARSVVLGALKDPSPQVAAEAARICIRLRLKPGASELAGVLRESENQQRLTVCLSALERSGRWERLIFLLEAMNMDADRTRLLEALNRWNQAFNLSYTQPTEVQVVAISHHLLAGGLALSDQMTRDLDFTLKPFGVVVLGTNHSLQARKP